MNTSSLSQWLVLAHGRGIGTMAGHRLLEHFGSIEAVFDASDSELKSHLRHGDALSALRAAADPGLLEQTRRWHEQEQHHIISWPDPAYPELLREINDPPLLLYWVGDPAYLRLPYVAIVGSRNPTPTGSENALAFAAALGRMGIGTASGLALGIDAAAHRGALSAAFGTIAVLGTGVDRVYPASNRDLAHAVAAGGGLISEFPLGTGPRREHFPRRNRIISGLSLGVMVVEAAIKSGSLITARLAAEQGREVFAIPGSIHSPQSRGCHQLIREGAKLVETAGDIVEELGSLAAGLILKERAAHQPIVAQKPGIEEDGLLAYMGYDPVTVDALVERSGLTTEVICSMLSRLELQGDIKSCAGGSFIRATNTEGVR